MARPDARPAGRRHRPAPAPVFNPFDELARSVKRINKRVRKIDVRVNRQLRKRELPEQHIPKFTAATCSWAYQVESHRKRRRVVEPVPDRRR